MAVDEQIWLPERTVQTTVSRIEPIDRSVNANDLVIRLHHQSADLGEMAVAIQVAVAGISWIGASIHV